MTTGIGNRILSNPYAGSVLNETKSKTIENKGTQTDQVLDLSGSPEQIAAEISSQDINSIKAIKINNSLVTMSPKQIESLITELKSKCLDSNNKLKPDIKFDAFQATTGTDVEINAVETKLESKPIESPVTPKETSIDNDPITQNTLSISSKFTDTIKSKDPKQISNLLIEVDTQIKNIDSEIAKLNEAPDANKSRIDQLTNQKSKLEQKKEVLALLTDITNSSGKIDKEIASPTSKTASNHGKLMSGLAAKLQEEATVLMSKLDGMDPEVVDACSDHIKQAIDSSKKANEESLLMTASSGQVILGKGGSINGIKETYRVFQAIVKPTSERTAEDKKLVGDSYRVGYQPTTESFLKSINDDIKGDIASAAKLKDLSADIQSGKITSEAEIRQRVNSALPGIRRDKINVVTEVYTNALKLKNAGTQIDWVKKAQEAFNVSTGGKSLEEIKSASAQIEKTLNSVTSVDISKAHLAPKSQGQLQVANQSNISTKAKLETELNQVKAKTAQLEEKYVDYLAEQEKKKAEAQLSGQHSLLDGIDENIAFGSHKTISFEGLASVGVDSKLLKGTLEAGYKLEFTVEKSDGPDNTPVWLGHVDLSAIYKAEGSMLWGIMKGEASAEFTGTAGLGFGSLQEAKDFGAKLQRFIKSGDPQLGKEVMADIKKYSYAGVAGKLSAEAEFGHDFSVGASVKAGGKVYGTGVTESYVEGKIDFKAHGVGVTITRTSSTSHKEGEKDQKFTSNSIKLEFPAGALLPAAAKKALAQMIFAKLGGSVPLHDIEHSIKESELKSKQSLPQYGPKAKIGITSEVKAVGEIVFAEKTDPKVPGNVLRRYEIAAGKLSKTEIEIGIPPQGTTPGFSGTISSEEELLVPIVEYKHSVPEGSPTFTKGENGHMGGVIGKPIGNALHINDH